MRVFFHSKGGSYVKKCRKISPYYVYCYLGGDLMRKLLLLFFATLFLVACGASDDSNITMDSFKQAFENEGITVDTAEKPLFQMINAKDGVIFYNQENVVKIYQFESSKDLKAAKDANTFMIDWPENGLFTLETSDSKAIEIFNGVK